MADKRDQDRITHSLAELLAQKVYSILGGYEDGKDAKLLRNVLLMMTMVGRSPNGDALASTSTINRFFDAYTQREAHLEEDQRSTLQERQTVQINRIEGLNEFLVDTFERVEKLFEFHVGRAFSPSPEHAVAEPRGRRDSALRLLGVTVTQTRVGMLTSHADSHSFDSTPCRLVSGIAVTFPLARSRVMR